MEVDGVEWGGVGSQGKWKGGDEWGWRGWNQGGAVCVVVYVLWWVWVGVYDLARAVSIKQNTAGEWG